VKTVVGDQRDVARGTGDLNAVEGVVDPADSQGAGNGVTDRDPATDRGGLEVADGRKQSIADGRADADACPRGQPQPGNREADATDPVKDPGAGDQFEVVGAGRLDRGGDRQVASSGPADLEDAGGDTVDLEGEQAEGTGGANAPEIDLRARRERLQGDDVAGRAQDGGRVERHAVA